MFTDYGNKVTGMKPLHVDTDMEKARKTVQDYASFRKREVEFAGRIWQDNRAKVGTEMQIQVLNIFKAGFGAVIIGDYQGKTVFVWFFCYIRRDYSSVMSFIEKYSVVKLSLIQMRGFSDPDEYLLL